MLAGVISCYSMANNPAKVSLTHIPKVLDYDTPNAPYNKLIKKIKQQLTLDVDFQYMPSERGTRLLSQGKIDCIFPIIPGDYPRQEKTQFSAAVNGISLHLFALDNIYTTLPELNQKVVVHLRGYLFANYVYNFPEVTFFPTANQLNALKMLKSGRASAYLDYIPDVRFSLPQSAFKQLKFDLNKPVLKSSDRFECKASGKPLQFLQHAEAVIGKLKKSGELKELLGAYYAPI